MTRALRIPAALFAGIAVLAAPGCSKTPGVQACPARFVGRPLPADYREIEVAAPDVPARCHELGSTMSEPLGCYHFVRHIAIVPSCATDPIICHPVKLHERCHAGGWPADHPL